MINPHQVPNNVQGNYAVIFSYQLSDNLDGYEDMDKKTIDAVVDVPGYLGYDKFGDGNQNTFISYWNNPRGFVRHNDVVVLYEILEKIRP